MIIIEKKEKTMGKPVTMMIDDVKYIREDSIKQKDIDMSKIVLIRTYSAGVHFGNLKEHDRANSTVVLINAKRLHQWSGACSLSQVAMDGVDLNNSRISVFVPEITLGGAIEIIPMSQKAAFQMIGAKEWKK